MKLIIDIPDIDYEHIKEYYEKNDIVEATYSYIYHGTPLNEVLDKIRAELHATAEMHEDKNYYLRDKWIDEIIDKYREGNK